MSTMSSSPLSIVVVAVAFVAAGGFLLVLIRQLKAGKNVQPGACRLPPGPRPWPVVGNLVNLAILLRNGDVATGSSSDATKQKKPQPLHAALACLSRVYGPVIHLRLGWQLVVVVSSADAAREALRINDRSLAGRSSPAVYRVPWYVDHSMVWSGDDEPRWRHLRSLCRSHLMGAGRLDVHAGVRERKAWEMVGFLREEAKFGRTVKVADMVFRTVLDVFGWMMFSREDTAGGFHEGARGSVNWDIKKDMAKALELGKVPNLEDFFPSVFGGWDLQGIRKEIKQILKRSYAWFDEMVNQRKEEMKSQELQPEGREHASSQGSVVHRDVDFLDVLLKAGVDGNPLKALLQDLFGAGIDTTTTCIEWTMAELVKNPHVMARLKHELSSSMGQLVTATNRIGTDTLPPWLRESHLLHLPYLQACIKESLRLHPPVPLLLPHRAKEPCELAGYNIAEDSVVLVNAWAIGRDTQNWGADTLVYDPDRYLHTDGGAGKELKDLGGLEFNSIPFGYGRRACPGMALAYRFVSLLVASMVYYFDWKLPGCGDKEMDLTLLSMEEKQGLVLERKEPLVLVPRPASMCIDLVNASSG